MRVAVVAEVGRRGTGACSSCGLSVTACAASTSGISCQAWPPAQQRSRKHCHARQTATGSWRVSADAHTACTPGAQVQRTSSPEGPAAQGWELRLSRRPILGALAAALTTGAGPAQASRLPAAFDRAWEGLGGGPPDLVFPEEWAGVWAVESTLTNVQLPLGPDFVPDPKVVQRARDEDLNRPISYEVAFIHNRAGRLVTDRHFNTAHLLAHYMGDGALRDDAIAWNPNDPNVLTIRLPGGLGIRTRVTRRSQAQPGDAGRLDTSEFFEQVYDVAGRPEPRVKASQCFTKYRWRAESAAGAGGAAIVATQVVSDYLTPYDGEMLMMRAQNNPVTVYTYRMAFRRSTAPAGPTAA